jgi:hypothetical protein
MWWQSEVNGTLPNKLSEKSLCERVSLCRSIPSQD